MGNQYCWAVMEAPGRIVGRTIRNDICFLETMSIKDQLAAALSRSVIAIRRFDVVADRSREIHSQRCLPHDTPEWGSRCKARTSEKHDELAE